MMFALNPPASPLSAVSNTIKIRFSGLSFSYNSAYAIFGGLTPVVLSLWLKSDRLAPAHYVAALSVLGCALAFVKPPQG